MVNTKKRPNCNVGDEPTRPVKRSRDNLNVKSVSLIDKVAFKKHKESLSTSLCALQSTSKDDCDTQSSYMNEILSQVATWLPHIWKLMETGTDLKLAVSCLSCCDQTLRRAWASDSQISVRALSADVVITNAAGTTVFKTTYYDMKDAVTWFWRELLVMDAVTKHDPSESLKILDGLSHKDVAQVYALIRRGDQTLTKDHVAYFDTHWTKAMRSAARKLLSGWTNKRLANFAKKPSFALYKALVNPDNQDSLLDVVRNEVAQGDASHIPLNDVVKIYQKGGLLDEIVTLIPKIDNKSTLLTISQVLSRSDVLEHRKAGLDLLRINMPLVYGHVMQELEAQFPHLAAAKQWLEKDAFSQYQKDHPLMDYLPPYQEILERLNAVVEEFVERASGRHPDHESNDEDDNICDDDIDCEDHDPDSSIVLIDYLRVLHKWPRQEESQALWDELRWTDGADPFRIDGITAALGRDCQAWRPFLSDTVVKIVCEVFACEDVKEIAEHLPKVSSRGSRQYAGTAIRTARAD